MKDLNEIKENSVFKEMFHQFFNNSSDPLFIIDLNFKFTEFNKAFDELFQKLIVGDKREFLMDLFDKEKTLDSVLEALQRDQMLNDMAVVLRDSEDERIYALLSLIEIKDENNVLVGYQGIVHDETKRVIAQRKLERAQKIAMTGRMVRIIAHEIRNPLTNVTLAAASLLESELSVDDVMMVEMIDKNVNRINDLITELLDSSKPADLILEEVSLQMLVSKSLELANDRMDLQGVTLTFNFPEEAVLVRADALKVKLVLNNIFINAIEAMENGGDLKVTIKKSSKQASLSIEDNGIGMSKDILANLFDPFFTGKANGTGIGLAAVQNIMESHGWNIEVESEVEVGTTFYISMDILQ